MELAVVTTIGLLGYLLREKDSYEDYEDVKIKPNNIKNNKLEENSKQIIPFSKRRINVPDHSTRLLDLYTGDPTFYKSKKETPNIFSTETESDIKMKDPSLLIDRSKYNDKFSNERKYQNVPLTQPINVGPGINTEDISKGGFHQFYRKMPRIEELGISQRGDKGRINHGTEKVSRGTLKQLVQVDETKTRFTEDFPLEKGKSVYNAPEIRSKINLTCTNRGDKNETQVNSVSGVQANGSYVISKNTNINTNRSLQNCGTITNLHKPNTGSYFKTAQMVPTTERGEELCDNVTAAHKSDKGYTVRIQDDIKTTIRQLTSCTHDVGSAKTIIDAPIAPTKHDLYSKTEHRCYAPGPGRMNKVLDAINLTTEKNDNNCQREGNIFGKNENNFTKRPENVKESIKITTQRPLDLDTALEQLKTNDLAISIHV